LIDFDGGIFFEELGLRKSNGAFYFYMKGTPFFHIFWLSRLQLSILDDAIEAITQFFIVVLRLITIENK
jgi:hypothetical protein